MNKRIKVFYIIDFIIIILSGIGLIIVEKRKRLWFGCFRKCGTFCYTKSNIYNKYINIYNYFDYIYC